MIARAVTLAAFVAIASAIPALSADVSYTCSNGTSLTASFSPPGVSPGQAVLVVAGSKTKLTLPQVKSADGGRYANSDVEFWIRGKDATLTRGARRETCQSK